MYPNLYYAFKDFFGVEINWLRFVNSFGFFVALAFVAAAFILTLELKRKAKQGLLVYKEEKIIVGKPVSIAELLTNFFLGGLLGYKIIGAFISNAPDPQQYIFSTDGNIIAGLLLGTFFAGLKWYEKKKQVLPKPEEKIIRIWPHDRVGDIVIFAAVFGFAGAKVFHNLENWNEFVNDPLGSLVSFSGLTFYGGLICAALAIWWYAKKHNIGFWYLNDAAAPALMLAYAIGRIGCQVSGDGDWGILNSAFLSNENGKVFSATAQQFQEALITHQNFYVKQFGGIEHVHHANFSGLSFLPDWMLGYTYPHNVVNEGVALSGCTGPYCSYLPIAVFPTPFYETIMCLALFGFLWYIRKKIKVPGVLFGIYLMVNGFERFMIEKIRVNTTYNILGFHPTQAELISFGLFITGLLLVIFLNKKNVVAKK
jgi:phosphatidylglycerol---prolipoprotein diacylglyceryl transferase